RHVRFLIFSFERYSTLRDLHSFPTRRSSDLGNHPLGGHPGYLDVTKGGTGLEITAIGRAQAVMLDPGGSSTALQRLEAPTGAVRYLSASDTGVISWQTISLSGSVPSVGAGWTGRVLQVTGASTY